MIVKKLNSPMIISRNLRFIILGDVIFYKQTIIIFFLFPKVHGWKDRTYVIGHFSAKNISFENGIFHSLYKNPKVHGWKDRRYVIEHFSAKNISFENGIFHSLYKNPKVHGWKDRRYVIGHFSAKNISFEIRKK